MQNEPLVSIIMNCYNGEKFLNHALKSVIDQSYSKWELIFWDNKSVDNSSEILKSFKEKRFKYFLAEKHTTLCEARNLAIEKSSGEFIAFLDTDDWWDIDKLKLQLDLFKDEKINFVYGNCWLVNENAWIKKKIFSRKNLPTGNILGQILTIYKVPLPTIMIRKNAFNKTKFSFDKRYQIIGDFDVCIRLSTIWEFGCIQKPIAFYRIHDKSFSYLNMTTAIYELQNWHKEIQNHPIISNRTELKNVSETIKYLKSLNVVISDNFFKGLNELISFPLSFNKLKLATILFLPKFISKKVKTFGI